MTIFNATYQGIRLQTILNHCFTRNLSKLTNLKPAPRSNNCFDHGTTSWRWFPPRRWMGRDAKSTQIRNKSVLLYMSGIAVLVVGLSYAAVPLYTIFCQATSYGGQTVVGHDADKVAEMKRVAHRKLRVQFNADTVSSLTWNFKPQQAEILVSPGETALAFYTATNPTDRAITGIATYNVLPFEAGQYFNKIQCFCFEEQRLNPHEQVDMPVFFYIDPDFANDPKMEEVNSLILSYTFFEAKEGLVLPVPGYAYTH